MGLPKERYMEEIRARDERIAELERRREMDDDILKEVLVSLGEMIERHEDIAWENARLREELLRVYSQIPHGQVGWTDKRSARYWLRGEWVNIYDRVKELEAEGEGT